MRSLPVKGNNCIHEISVVLMVIVIPGGFLSAEIGKKVCKVCFSIFEKNSKVKFLIFFSYFFCFEILLRV